MTTGGAVNSNSGRKGVQSSRKRHTFGARWTVVSDYIIMQELFMVQIWGQSVVALGLEFERWQHLVKDHVVVEDQRRVAIASSQSPAPTPHPPPLLNVFKKNIVFFLSKLDHWGGGGGEQMTACEKWRRVWNSETYSPKEDRTQMQKLVQHFDSMHLRVE